MYYRHLDNVTISEGKDNLTGNMYFWVQVFDNLIKGRRLVNERHDDFYSAAASFIDWLLYEPEEHNEVLAHLLVGEDTAGLPKPDKEALIQKFGSGDKLRVEENGSVVENIEIVADGVGYGEDGNYLVGVVTVDGTAYSFDYNIVTQETDIHHYSDPSWLDGSSCEKVLPSVITRNIDVIDSEICRALQEFFDINIHYPSAELIEEALADGWSQEDVDRGYAVFSDDNGAQYIARLDILGKFAGDWLAAEHAEKDGFNIIRDKIRDFPYLDTPENREVLKNAEKADDFDSLLQDANTRAVDCGASLSEFKQEHEL